MEISVAMCTYNGADYLSDQIESILEQSNRPSEIVVRDDGSTDGTMAILKDYAQDYPELFDVKQNEENQGIVKNFEKAIQACSGDYIALSDQDDVWNPMKIKHQASALQRSNAILACHNSSVVTKTLEPVGDLWSEVSPSYKPQTQPNPTKIVRELAQRNFVQGATIMFDARWTDHLLPLPEGWPHDHYLAVHAALRGGLIPIDEELIRYRQHDEQEVGVTNKNIVEQFQDNLKSGYEQSRIKRWQQVYEFVRSCEDSELGPEKSWLEKFLKKKVRYEQRRSEALCGESLITGISAIYCNLTTGSYSQFDYGIRTAANDITMVFLKPIIDL
ncbi:glycosyltransferase family 2 protein [Halorubrum sp. Atlit-28R]|uniref:glycosyltransferase family 2 protein n=1 Tax=Halorubrum sp. Atlit-28R TaxID=2282129 RepID=UPI001313FDE6|nr:glycosyltransferase family 2 protein [Halorubrum sp. Atlit-28R]